MRVLPYLLLLLLVATACAQERNNLDDHNLRGEVLGVFQYTYEPVLEGGDYVAGELAAAGHLLYHFNTDGQQIEQQYVDDDYGTDMRNVTTVRDGMPVAGILYDERGDEFAQIAYLTEGRKVMKWELFSRDGDRQQLSYDYAPGEELPHSIHVEKNGSPADWSVFTYEDGRLTSSTTYGRGDTLISRAVYTLDDDGNWSTQTFTRPGQDLNYRIDYTDYVYDARDNWIERRQVRDGELDVIEKRRIFYREELGKPTRERLLGTWYSPEERGFITLRADGSCNLDGDPGGKWSIDQAQQALTIIPPPPEPSLQFRFRLDTFRVYLTSLDGGEDITLDMR